MLTVNTPYSTDLAAHIKCERIKVKELKEGDIIVDDHSVYHAVVTPNDDGTFDVFDEDGNGSPNNPPGQAYTIIARECLR